MTAGLRRLSGADWRIWRDLRLTGLREFPEVFLSTREAELARSEEAIREQIDGGDTFGAFEDGTLVGMASLDPETAPVHVHRAWLNPLYVVAERQGTGVAQRLVDAVVGAATARGVIQIELFVAADNARAIRFYERNGFVRHGQLPRTVKLPDRYQDYLHYVSMLDGRTDAGGG